MIKRRRPDEGTSAGPSTRYKPVARTDGQRVMRDRILERVFSPGAPDIVILNAPAGHGKSTALRQIRDECQAHQVRCAWLNLDDSDNDARHHSTHLQQMLGQLFQRPECASDAPTPSVSRLQERADWFIEVLDRDPSPVALFVDDYEVLSDAVAIAFWRNLLSKLPDHVRVFIATRVSPDLGIPRLTVSGRLLVLSAQDLCFSEEEVRYFLQSNESVPTPAGDVQAIYRAS